MISDKVKAWLAAGAPSGHRSAESVLGCALATPNTPDATEVHRLLEGALRSIEQTITALELYETATPSGDETTGAPQPLGSPLRKVLREARLGISTEAEAFRALARAFAGIQGGAAKPARPHRRTDASSVDDCGTESDRGLS